MGAIPRLVWPPCARRPGAAVCRVPRARITCAHKARASDAEEGSVRIVARTGGTTIELSPELESFVDRLTREAAPATRAVMDEALTRVYLDAVNRWPGKTGESKRALDHGISAASLDEIRGYVACDVGYARYIKSAKIPGSGSAFV